MEILLISPVIMKMNNEKGVSTFFMMLCLVMLFQICLISMRNLVIQSNKAYALQQRALCLKEYNGKVRSLIRTVNLFNIAIETGNVVKYLAWLYPGISKLVTQAAKQMIRKIQLAFWTKDQLEIKNILENKNCHSISKLSKEMMFFHPYHLPIYDLKTGAMKPWYKKYFIPLELKSGQLEANYIKLEMKSRRDINPDVDYFASAEYRFWNK